MTKIMSECDAEQLKKKAVEKWFGKRVLPISTNDYFQAGYVIDVSILKKEDPFTDSWDVCVLVGKSAILKFDFLGNIDYRGPAEISLSQFESQFRVVD